MVHVHPTRSEAKSLSSPPSRLHLRRDIQGLRALAVGLVIMDHLLGWPAGGFIGVDVFFVISGFLITSLLQREYERSGRISIRNFYKRRIRRILPVAVLVLAVTVGVSSFIFLPDRAEGIGVDALWALLFATNWHFAAVGTNYWANDGLVSPVQHYWSLAVEEQFYLVWPMLLIVGLTIAQRRGWSQVGKRYWISILTLTGVVGSFIWALFESVDSPLVAYFSTFSRAWELGVGAVLALLLPSWSGLRPPLRAAMAWLGLFGITASAFIISSGSRFPAPWAALPVLATALVIVSSPDAEQRSLRPLTNRAVCYVGDISYSLYLWHFPVAVLLPAVIGRSVIDVPAALLLTLGLSIASYHLVERPIHNSHWLEDERKRRKHRRRRSRRARTAAPVKVATGALALVTIAVWVFALQSQSRPELNVLAVPTPAQERGAASTTPASLGPDEQLTRDIGLALQAKEFPSLEPSVDDLGTDKWWRNSSKLGCMDVSADMEKTCESGSGSAGKDVAILGDSYAMAWMPGLRKVFEPLGWRVHMLTLGQCPWLSVEVSRNGGPFPECTDHRKWALEQVASMKPDMVILADAGNASKNLASGAQGAAAGDEIARGLSGTLAALKGHDERTVILAPPPTGINLQDCVTRISEPSACISQVKPEWWEMSGLLKEAAEAGDASYIDTRSWFCSEADTCPGFVGRTPVKVDGSHMTIEYSQGLAPLLRRSIAP